LAGEAEARLLQRNRKRLFIYRLQKSGSELSIDLKEQSNQAFGDLVVLEVYPMPSSPTLGLTLQPIVNRVP
jgi:hypothetical protein